MKKSILGLITVFLLIIIFAGCSAQSLGTAVPGNVKICLTTVDEMLIPEYSHSIDNAALINEFKVLEWEVDSSYTPSETKTLNFRGKTYETKFLLSSKLCMRSYSYDVYTYGSPNDADWMEFHVAHGNDDKIVGFRYNGAWVETPSSVPKSEKELIDIATEALSEFMDADYYTNVNVELMEMFNIWWVEFYNTIGDVEVADSSIVQLDMDGNVLGQHKGIIHYTVGQRKGLGLTAPTPLFVKELRPDTNEVVICQSEQLFEKECYVKDMNYMGMPELKAGEEVEAIGKVRYSHKGAPCKLMLLEDGRVLCRFDEPQRAMTPGQAAVFYKDDYVLCGGTIDRK